MLIRAHPIKLASETRTEETEWAVGALMEGRGKGFEIPSWKEVSYAVQESGIRQRKTPWEMR